MRHVFLVNPAAGRCDRTAQIKRDAEAALGSRGIPFTLCVSRGPGDLTRYARDAVVSGEDVVLYACGGDGTLNEVLQGAASFTNAVLTHIPSGSGNDFVKLFDDPAAFRDLDRLLSGREVHLDLIRVKADGKSYYAANICSMGLDARIGTQIDRYRRFPGLGGKGAYLASTVVNVLKGTRQPFTIDFGSRRVSGEKTLICICNGSWYGGSFHPVPDARADDGLLDVLTVDAVSLPRLATTIGAYKKGLYARFPGLIDHCRTDALTVTCPTPPGHQPGRRGRHRLPRRLYPFTPQPAFFDPGGGSAPVEEAQRGAIGSNLKCALENPVQNHTDRLFRRIYLESGEISALNYGAACTIIYMLALQGKEC